MSIQTQITRPVCPTPRRRFDVRLLGGLLCVAASLPAQILVDQAVAQFDQLVRNYNLISFGNASFTNFGDTEGPLAVGGNLYLDGGSVGNSPAKYGLTSDPTLYVSGQLTLNNFTHLNSGYASTPGLDGGYAWDATQRRLTGGGGTLSTSNSSHPLASTDPRSNPAPANWSWSSLQSDLIAVSSVLAAAPATGTIQISGQNLQFVTPEGQTSGVVVFTLDMADFSGNLYDANGSGTFDPNNERVSNVQINVPEGVAYVINVVNANGTTLFGGGGINFNAGTNNDQLLWNILPDDNPATADAVRLGGGASFYGSVLAPLVDLGNSGNVAINGQVVAATFTQSNAELHYIGFDSPVVFSPVPEPSTWGVGAILVVGGAVALQHRRARRQRTPQARS